MTKLGGTHKIRKRKTCLFLSEREEEMLGELIANRGYVWYADALRDCIRGWHGKCFPIYTKSVRDREEKEKITNEKYCTDALGGVVDEREQLCRIKEGSLKRVIPLGLVKNY